MRVLLQLQMRDMRVNVTRTRDVPSDRGPVQRPLLLAEVEEGRDELGILIESLLSWKSCTKSRKPQGTEG